MISAATAHHLPVTDPAAQFRDAIRAAGLEPPEVIERGNFHRFPGVGKRNGNTAAWCKLFDDGLGGCFGDWSSGFSEHWQAKRDKPFSAMEREAFKRHVAEAQAQAEAECKARQDEAAKKAAAIWQAARPAPDDHPYLISKGIKAHGLRLHKETLVVPMRDGAELHSLQFIAADGEKRFLTGGRTAGCYFSIGTTQGAAALCIAEGFATSATIYEATQHPVAVVFSAGNLLPVAQALREKFPEMRLILCADDDLCTDGNPGMTKAREAAHAVSGLLAIPDFGSDRPDGATDLNDLHRHTGADAVRACIERAAPPDHADPGDTAGDDLKGQKSDKETIEHLAALSPLEYDRVRKDNAKALEVRPGTLDKMVATARKTDGDDDLCMADVEPWPDPIDPARLLTAISATVARFVVCNPETAHAAALWVAMTWLMDAVSIAPLAAITAPEKRCGKSQLLFILGRLSHRPLTASNISPAAMFRAIDAWRPTLLVDECDAFMRDNEELRGIINAGHTRDSAYVVRVVGEDLKPQRFSVWGAKALAGIGHLADTLMDRAIILVLRRKLPTEHVDRLRHAEDDLFQVLAAKLARFANDNRDAIRRARPDLPDSLNDRAQDNWEPLLAIADVAGGEWPELARKAALKLSGTDSPTMTIGTELLADIQELFEGKGVERIRVDDLIEALCADDEKPWATYNRGKPITPRQVAKKLSEYHISSQTIRFGSHTKKGYYLKSFEEAFARYLAPSPLPSVTPSQPSIGAASRVTDDPSRYGNKNESVTPKPLQHKACDGVTDKKGGEGKIDEVEV